MNETATLLIFLIIIYIIYFKFYTLLTAISRLFVSALYEWNITKTNSCAYFNVTGK